MAIEYRLLTSEEYPLLAEMDHGEAGFAPDPKSSIVAGAFDEGKLIGCMTIVLIPHIEGTWIAEGSRRGLIGKRMEQLIVEGAAQWGVRTMLAFTETEQHGNYMKRMGWTKTSYTVWKKEAQCQSLES